MTSLILLISLCFICKFSSSRLDRLSASNNRCLVLSWSERNSSSIQRRLLVGALLCSISSSFLILSSRDSSVSRCESMRPSKSRMESRSCWLSLMSRSRSERRESKSWYKAGPLNRWSRLVRLSSSSSCWIICECFCERKNHYFTSRRSL